MPLSPCPPSSPPPPGWRPRLTPGTLLLVVAMLGGAWFELTRDRQQARFADNVPESAMRRRMLLVDEWVELGETAVPLLRTNLLSGQSRRQLDAALAATRLGEAASALRPELVACLDSDEVSVREQALTALLAQSAARRDLLPRLARLLRDPAFAVRSLAAHGLDQATPADLEQALTATRADPSTQLLRLARCKGASQLTPGEQIELRQWMHDPALDDLLRAECLELLIWHDVVELDDLLFSLDQQGPELGGLALRQIEGWGPRAAPAAPLLARLLQTGSPAAQAAGLKALGWLGPAAAPVLPQIEQYLYADVCFNPVPASELIHGLGGDTQRAAALLRRRLLGEVPGPDQPAALARLDPGQTAEVIAILAARVTRHDANLRSQLWLLKYFGPAAGPALPALRPLLGARDDPCRLNALEVCARLGTAAAPALPELTAVLAEPTASAGVDGALQLAALQALSGLQGAAAEAAPDLLRACALWETLPREAFEGGRLDLAGLQTLLDIAPRHPGVQTLCTRWLDGDDPARSLLATRGTLLGTPPPIAGPVAARARDTLADPPPADSDDEVLLEDLRLALLDTLAATTLPDPATVAIVWQWAVEPTAPLPRRLHALQCLAEFPPGDWPPEIATGLVRDIDSWLAAPAGAFPGPSRLAPTGQLFRDRYRPDVQARVSVRHWLRHLRELLDRPPAR